MNSNPKIPNELKDKYEIRQHLTENLYVVEATVPNHDHATQAEIHSYLNRHNIIDLDTKEVLLERDYQGQISLTKNSNFILVCERNNEGLFSIKERRLIIPVIYEDVKVLSDTNEFFIVTPKHEIISGIVTDKNEVILPFQWNITYDGDCIFRLNKIAGGDRFEATFNANDRTLIYTNNPYSQHRTFIW
jgi:hypothetical protein